MKCGGEPCGWGEYTGLRQVQPAEPRRPARASRQDDQDPRAYADEAAEHIRVAIARRPPHAARSHALDHIGLAEARFLAGDLTAACEQTERAVAAAAATQSGRVRKQLAELYPYTVGRSASGRVRQARDSIRTLLVERSEG